MTTPKETSNKSDQEGENTSPVGHLKWLLSWRGFLTLSSVCFAAVYQFFSSNPKVLYIPGIGIALAVLIGTHLLVKQLDEKNTGDSPSQPTANELNIRDSNQPIQSTGYDYKRVSELFPFGYELIFVAENGKFRHEEHRDTNNLLNWDADWKNVVIERDVAAMRMKLRIPARADTPADSPPGPVLHLSGPNNAYPILGFNARLETGAIAYGPIDVRNRPQLCVATLIDNQRTPVFAIGFRIKTDAEQPPRRPAAK